MRRYSKRDVRDAIRVLGYAAQHNVVILEAERGCGLVGLPDNDAHVSRVYVLGRAARQATGQEAAPARRAHRDTCAAAENLLREGWLPDEDPRPCPT